MTFGSSENMENLSEPAKECMDFFVEKTGGEK